MSRVQKLYEIIQDYTKLIMYFLLVANAVLCIYQRTLEQAGHEPNCFRSKVKNSLVRAIKTLSDPHRLHISLKSFTACGRYYPGRSQGMLLTGIRGFKTSEYAEVQGGLDDTRISYFHEF